MCGIIGYIGNKQSKDVLIDGLKRLEYRGYDSAGVAILEKDGVSVFKCEGRVEKLEERLGGFTGLGTLGIGHTRWATHGAPTESNAHPHRVGSIVLVHNGIIENYLEHKATLVALGRKISSETDSEIVAHLFDIALQTGMSLETALLEVLPKLRGSYAFLIMTDREPDKIVGVRNGAPLLVGVGDGENFIASDVHAILHRTRDIIYLDDHQFAICERTTSPRVKGADGSLVKPSIKRILWNAEEMDKSGYRHYMLKEIHEQPRAITNTIEGNVDHKTGVIRLSSLEGLNCDLRKIDHVSIVACGTAKHAALVGKYYIERFARVGVVVDYGSEFRYRDPVLERNSELLIVVSQSGETADTLAAVREGLARKIPTLAICNVRESTIAREADTVLYTNAGPEIGVCSTKAFTTQLVVLYMLAIQLGLARGAITQEEAIELTQDLVQLPFLVEKVLLIEKQMEKIALSYFKHSFFFFIGRGICFPIALEGALKLKEISYLHAEGYPAGELKHGPIALVDEKVMTIALSPQDRAYSHGRFHSEPSNYLYEKMMSNIQEVRARGGSILSVGTEGDEVLSGCSKYSVALPRSTWGMNPILASIPVQFFAYYVALQKGTDIDKPRNLAKSVTVE